MTKKTNIVHLGEWVRETVKKKYRPIKLCYLYYSCIRAVGVANPHKVTFNKKNVTCKNCIKWYLK
jgi:hypothetical protein